MHIYINDFEHIAKRMAKMIISVIFFYSGLFFIVRMINNCRGRKLTIVAYHRVSDQPADQINKSLPFLFVSQRLFDAHVRFYKKFYHIITFSDIAEYEKNGGIPPNSLIITFDDGYEDNYSLAFPVLKKNNVSAVIFVATNFIGTKMVSWWDEIFFRLSVLNEKKSGFSDPEKDNLSKILERFNCDPAGFFGTLGQLDREYISKLIQALRLVTPTPADFLDSNRFMNTEQIQGMKNHIEFGSHTCSHVSLEVEKSERAMTELNASRHYLSELTRTKICSFAYPTGHYSARSSEMVKQAGYQYAVTLDIGINDLRNRYALKRINVWEGTVKPVLGEFSRSVMAFVLSGLKL
jgi:peptidoglycan/xylan/chitin deacetylase (PgdA/CDA1 family)